MNDGTARETWTRLLWSALALLVVLLIGTVGYGLLTSQRSPPLDCLFMTFITISTIGYEEVVNLHGNDAAKIFTMFIALSGIGVVTFALSTLTAFIIEGDINRSFKFKTMEKKIKELKDHYIVCGAGRVGRHIIEELYVTKRPFVLIDTDLDGKITPLLDLFPDLLFVVGDAAENEILAKAGAARARGLFATVTDDNMNLVVCLTAKQVNPALRVIAHCTNIRHEEKMRKAGADSVVASEQIGGMRMASVMVRPEVVSFLDIMLRDKEQNLRVEEVAVPTAASGKSIADLRLKNYRHTLLLAVKKGGELIYNPPEDTIVETNSFLIVMTNPAERERLEKDLQD